MQVHRLGEVYPHGLFQSVARQQKALTIQQWGFESILGGTEMRHLQIGLELVLNHNGRHQDFTLSPWNLSAKG